LPPRYEEVFITKVLYVPSTAPECSSITSWRMLRSDRIRESGKISLRCHDEACENNTVLCEKGEYKSNVLHGTDRPLFLPHPSNAVL